jgi:hypothetical protein
MNSNVPVLPGSNGAQWRNPGTPSNATDDKGQGRQKWILRPEILANFQGDSEGNTGSFSFRVLVPDSRLRTKIVLVPQKPPAGSNFTLAGKGLTLWLRDTEFGIQTGTYFPVTNLWGTAAAPGPIPGTIDPGTGLPIADAGLNGFGKEFVTSGAAIEGTVNYPGVVNNGKGQLVLQVQYIAEAIRFPRHEWEEICSETGIILLDSSVPNFA